MAYEYFYKGTPYSLDSDYGSKAEGGVLFTGYRAKLGDFALTLDGRTANQLSEVSNKLNTGIKVMELSASDPALLDSIPKEQFKEINRLTKLTGGEVTLHGPQVEASGFGKEGWSEMARQSAERQMAQAVERAHDLNPKGNVPVTFHSTSQLPEGISYVKEGEKSVPKGVHIVETESGRYLGELKPKERHFPGEISEFNPAEEIKRLSKDHWSQELGNINFSALRGEQEVERFTEEMPSRLRTQGISEEESEKYKEFLLKGYAESRNNPSEFSKLPENLQKIGEQHFKILDHASVFLKDSYRGLREQFNKAYRDLPKDSEDRKRLEEYAKKITPLVEKNIPENKEKLQEFAGMIQEGVKVLNDVTPTLYKPLDEFVFDKSAATFGNVAFNAWKKFGDTAPIVSIENPPAGGGLSRAEDLRKLIEKARENFVKKAEEDGMSKSAAESAAEKLIGATWDVGHINMLRKFGYESKDIVKETEKIAPFVKHVHLSDNFGHEHTELPMGMGNVPIKEIMEKLGKEGFKGKKVIEAFQWWQHMKSPPLVPTLEAFGSPLYPMLAQPSWNQMAGTYGNYFQFPSAYMPEHHFALYGGGFSGLPQELGGQMPGKQNRLTGTPME